MDLPHMCSWMGVAWTSSPMSRRGMRDVEEIRFHRPVSRWHAAEARLLTALLWWWPFYGQETKTYMQCGEAFRRVQTPLGGPQNE